MAIEYLGGLANKHAHREHSVFFNDHPFNNLTAGTDEAVVLNDGWIGLKGFQNTANTHTAREMDIFTNLRTRTNRGPGVDHRTVVNIGPDVDVRGHQHDIFPDECPMSCARGRNDTKPGCFKVCV